MTGEEMVLTLTEHGGAIQRHEGRIYELEQRTGDLARLSTTVALMAQRQGVMEQNVAEIRADVKILTGKPARRYDAVVEKMILFIVAAVVAYILSKVGF